VDLISGSWDFGLCAERKKPKVHDLSTYPAVLLTIRRSKTSFSGSSHFLLLKRSSLRSSPHRKKDVYRTHAEHKYQQRLQSPPSESGPPAGHIWHTCSCSKQLRSTLGELIPISSIQGFLVHLPRTRITSRQAMIALRLLSFAG
jgi:hypothetical protein